METTIFQFFIFTVVNLIITLLTNFLFTYFKEKGKNLATKEDISAITKLVEEQKAELSNLSFRKIQFFTEEKEALILFYTQINEWIWDNLNIQLFHYNKTNIEQLDKKIISMHEIHNKVNVSFGKIFLLIDNQDLVKEASELINNIFTFHTFVENICSTLKKNLMLEIELLEKISNKENLNKTYALDGFYKKLERVGNNEEKLFEKYSSAECIDLFNQSLKLRDKFRDLAKEHLRNIIYSSN